jgi:ABC-type phosphate/phosphonate transport system substrate-binding protein
LRAQRRSLDRFFVDEVYCGAYAAALRAVARGEADVCGLHVLPDGGALDDAVAAHAPELRGALRAVEVTSAVPGDGVAATDAGAPLVAALAALPLSLLQATMRADGLAPAALDEWAALLAIAPPDL